MKIAEGIRISDTDYIAFEKQLKAARIDEVTAELLDRVCQAQKYLLPQAVRAKNGEYQAKHPSSLRVSVGAAILADRYEALAERDPAIALIQAQFSAGVEREGGPIQQISENKAVKFASLNKRQRVPQPS